MWFWLEDLSIQTMRGSLAVRSGASAVASRWLEIPNATDLQLFSSQNLTFLQLEKYSCKAAVVSKYCLHQINGILIELCDDQKVSAPQSKTEGEPTVTKTKAGLVTNTRKSFAKKQSKARPASETTEFRSLLDIDVSSDASAIVTSTASSSTLAPASSPASSSASKRSSST